MMRGPVLVLGTVVLLATNATAQPPRDSQRPATTGSSRITGVVLSAESQPRPLRRARVRITGSELEMSRTTITTDDGRFAFDSLPSGRYTVSASKDAFVSSAFGATRAGRPGRTIPLAPAEARDVRIQLAPGAVITGTLRDPQGDAVPGLTVLVLSQRFAPGGGEQRVMAVPGTEAITDDRGVYRVFGLAAGSYIVTALPRLPNSGVGVEVTPVSREDVQRALSELQQQRTSSRPGMPTQRTPAGPSAAPVRRIGVSFAPTYFPGTTATSRATPVTVTTGEVRTGVDFDLDYVPMSIVEGHVAVPDGSRVQLTLSHADVNAPYQPTTSATVAGDGRFTFRRVPPGHYVISARASSRPAPGTSALPAALWGRTEVVVAGHDIEGVGITLEPGLTLAGDLVFEGTTTPPALHGFRLPLQVRSAGVSGSPLPIPVVEGSQIVVRGAVPGIYQYVSPPQGVRTRIGPWWLKSIMMDDREVLDGPLEILPNTRSLRVTFSDKTSQLSGVVSDRAGAPVTDSYVVVFSEDAKSWFYHSRRVAAVQLDAQGRYAVSNLPAGDYFVAVTSDIENNEWFDPSRLIELRAQASRVTIAENQVVSRNITIGARQP